MTDTYHRRVGKDGVGRDLLVFSKQRGEESVGHSTIPLGKDWFCTDSGSNCCSPTPQTANSSTPQQQPLLYYHHTVGRVEIDRVLYQQFVGRDRLGNGVYQQSVGTIPSGGDGK